MKVTVIQLYQDKYTQELHKPGEELEITSAKRVQELMDAGVIDKVVVPDAPKEDLPFPESLKDEAPVEKPAKKTVTKKATTKRVKKND